MAQTVLDDTRHTESIAAHFAVLEDQLAQFNKERMKLKAIVAKFKSSLDAGKVDLAEVAKVWQFWWRQELKELASATHVLRSETGGAEEQAYSLFQENSSVGTKTSAGAARIHSRSSLVCRTDGRSCFGRHRGSNTEERPGAAHSRRD